jgi:hypothetical protein
MERLGFFTGAGCSSDNRTPQYQPAAEAQYSAWKKWL